MIVLLFIFLYCLIGFILAVTSLVVFSIADRLNLFPEMTLFYSMMRDREVASPLMFGLVWPFGMIMTMLGLFEVLFLLASRWSLEKVEKIESYLDKIFKKEE